MTTDVRPEKSSELILCRYLKAQPGVLKWSRRTRM